MLHVVLVAPEIAGNTGAIIRLCANVGAHLHLVEPLGFHFESAALRRAGLDYHDLADTTIYSSFENAFETIGNPERWFATTGRASAVVHEVAFADGDVFVFGRESDGLSDALLQRFDDDHTIRIPMRPNNRSLNLANATAIVVYEAWRQLGFAGAASLASDNNRR